MRPGNEIILYQSDDAFQLEVRVQNESVWLNRHQVAALFDRDIKTIGKHINNALKEELRDVSVVAKFATTASDGKVYQVDHYRGASLKDLGRKWFAFSKMSIEATSILAKLADLWALKFNSYK